MSQPKYTLHFGDTAIEYTLTYAARTLQLVMETFGPDRVMIGTDYPFVIADGDPHATVDALGLDRAAAQALREGNARRFLGLS